MFSSLDVLNKVFVGRESFWAMIFYTLFRTLIFSPSRLWVGRADDDAVRRVSRVRCWCECAFVLFVKIIFHGGR